MKYSNRLLAVLLAFTLFVPCAAMAEDAAPAAEETAFVFRGGITWDTPAEEIAAAEGVDQSAVFTMQGDTYTGYMLQGALVFNTPAYIYYYYRNDILVAAWCSFMPMPAFGFAERLEQYTGEYGEPTEFDTLMPTVLSNLVIPGILDEEEILELAGWELADGTRIYLMNVDDNPEFICFNTQALGM